MLGTTLSLLLLLLLAPPPGARAGPKWRDDFTSTFELMGEKFYSTCDCVGVRASPKTDMYPNSRCTPPKNFTVTRIKEGQEGYEPQLVGKMVGRPVDMRLVNIRRTSFSDVDSRDPIDDLTLRTLGGDMAQFIYFLRAFELRRKINNEPLYQETVDLFLEGWLQFTPRQAFSFQTDQDAVDRIKRILVEEHEFPKEQPLDIANPPPPFQRALLTELMRPSHQGNLHIRLMLKHPNKFGISMLTIQRALRSFFTLLWNHGKTGVESINAGVASVTRSFKLYRKLKLVILVGKRQAGAWLNVVNSKECLDEGVVSLFTPHHDYADAQMGRDESMGNSLATDHGLDEDESSQRSNKLRKKKPRRVMVDFPEAASQLRRHWAEYLEKARTPTPVHEVHQLMDAVALNCTRITKEFLVRNLPEYNIVIQH